MTDTAARPEPADAPLAPGYNYELDLAFQVDPHLRWYELQQEHGRIFKSDVMPDWTVWYPLHYEDIKAALQDPEVFSSRQISAHADMSAITMIPEMLDPPEHGKYRHLLTSWFSPAAVAAREPEIRALAVQLIEALVGRGRCDVDSDFNRLFPTTVFLRWMGVDAEQIDEILPKAYEMFQLAERGDEAGAAQRQTGFVMEHIAALVDDRRANPRDDLVSALVGAEIDGASIGEDVFPILYLLYVAGLDTVAGELGYSFLRLAEDPQLQRLLRTDSSAVPGFVEEVLRRYALAATARVVTRDVEFAGCPFKAGDRVVLSTQVANLDASVFPDPLGFDPARDANRHFGFGAGPHRCLGSHLARRELVIALEEWHRLIPQYRLQDGTRDTLRHKPGSVTGLRSLPLQWTD